MTETNILVLTKTSSEDEDERRLYQDECLLGKDCKKRHTKLAMAWMDYKKAYEMASHSWVSECLEIFGIANNVQDFLNNSMKS